MCIICNLSIATEKFPDTHANTEKAEEFLCAFAAARRALAEASDAMLRCAQVERRYDKTHKRMVSLCHEWNSLEQFRESDTSETKH